MPTIITWCSATDSLTHGQSDPPTVWPTDSRHVVEDYAGYRQRRKNSRLDLIDVGVHRHSHLLCRGTCWIRGPHLRPRIRGPSHVPPQYIKQLTGQRPERKWRSGVWLFWCISLCLCPQWHTVSRWCIVTDRDRQTHTYPPHTHTHTHGIENLVLILIEGMLPISF